MKIQVQQTMAIQQEKLQDIFKPRITELKRKQWKKKGPAVWIKEIFH